MRKNSVLTKKQINALRKGLPEWKLLAGDSLLKRVFMTDTYITGLTLMARIAVHAEVLNHHPKMMLEEDKITIETSTHSEGGLTKSDITLAQAIDKILDKIVL